MTTPTRTGRRHRAALFAACAVPLALVGCGGTSAPGGAATRSGSTTTTGGASAAAAAGSSAAQYPVSVERCGRVEIYQEPPRRVVLGWGTSIRTLDALGTAGSVVGYVSGSNTGLPDGFTATKVSDDFQPAKEAVLAARPDLFLANDENQVSGQQGTATPDDLATQRGHTFVLGNYCLKAAAPGTIEAVYADVHDLGKVFGVPDRATRLVTDLTRRVAAAQALRRSSPVRSAAMVQIFDGKVYALSGSYYNAILQGAGLTNVFGDVGQNFAEISAERVLTAKPDALFIAHDDASGGSAALTAARRLFAASPAVAAGRIHAVSNLEISGGGVNIVTVIEQVAHEAYAAT